MKEFPVVIGSEFYVDGQQVRVIKTKTGPALLHYATDTIALSLLVGGGVFLASDKEGKLFLRSNIELEIL